MSGATIGIVDDEASMRDALAALLSENQFTPVPMASIAEFEQITQNTDLDLVVIDLHLHGESGLELAMKVRRGPDIPIVMLTGHGDEVDKIVGLEVGADDYLLKPFNPRELVARIRAVLRRCGKRQDDPKTAPTEPAPLAFGCFQVDLKKRAVFGGAGQEIDLTNSEFRLLAFFLSRPNEIIPRVELLTELGNDLSTYVDRTIDVLILRLRRKIEANPSKPVHLQTRRGQGYIFITDAAGIA